jgi:RNA polymerase sigma factor (sigma-70 family)
MDDGHDLVVRTIREHAPALLRTARRHSLCADDAHDAYQRALEIFLKRASTVDPATADRWLHVVVKHEAMAVRQARLELVGTEEAALDAAAADGAEGAEDRVLRWDRLSRSAEALQRLKPQELTALWLKASGMSYAEIAARQGWTYTKVNRCVTEGRRAFLARYAGIETGKECERWAPVVAALVDGEATAEQVAAARPHLRRCAACRATVRELRVAGPGLAGVLPALPLAGAAGATGGRLEGTLRVLESAWGAVQERAGLWAVKVQGGVEAASGAKLAAVASAAVVAGGGGAVAVHRAASVPRAHGHPSAARAQATARAHPAPARVALLTTTPAPPPPAARPATSATRPAATSRRARSAARGGEFSPTRTHAREFRATTGATTAAPSRSVREFRSPAPQAVATTVSAPVAPAPASEFRASAATSGASAGSPVVEHAPVREFGGG